MDQMLTNRGPSATSFYALITPTVKPKSVVNLAGYGIV